MRVAPSSCTNGSMIVSGIDLHFGIDHARLRSKDGDPGSHQAIGCCGTHACVERDEFSNRIGSQNLRRIASLQCRDLLACRVQQHSHVREVKLAMSYCCW